MEPITVKSKLDLKRYYRVLMGVNYGTNSIIAIVIAFVGLSLILNLFAGFYWVNEAVVLGVVIFSYGITLPAVLWLAAKKHIKVIPAFAEGATYNITEDHIEGVTSSTSEKEQWQHIQKVVEREEYFVLFRSASLFRYLPKDGFASATDIERFKGIVRENSVKASFK